MPWKLLGVHSGRLDMLPRDAQQDEFLGLNCTWYADILLTLTAGAGLAAALRTCACDAPADDGLPFPSTASTTRIP